MIRDAQLDHVAIAVRDVARAIPVYADALGGRFLFGGDNDQQGFRFVQFGFPNGGKVEFVTPTDESSFVARFLETRGEGVHHVTFKTHDLSAAISELRATGLEPIMVNITSPQWKEAFLHPRQASGTLVQIAQSLYSDEDMAQHHLSDHGSSDHRHLTFEDLLSGR